MKLKSLAVIALLVLGCSAAFGQNYSFGFGANTCDYESFTVVAPYVSGVHHLTGCGSPVDGALVGFKGTIPVPSGAIVSGGVVIMADNVFDASVEQFTGCQIVLVSRTKASSKKFGWAEYLSCGDGDDNLLSWGYLTPHPGKAGSNASFGTVATTARNKR